MNFLRTRIINRKIIANTVQLQSCSSSNTSPAIKVPMRIERGPTDILQALDTTVSRDPTAPEYKFIDDPFLIPTSFAKKRSYALSRESGKKAAMWVLQEHADLLRSQLSEPLIEAFLPLEKYEDKSQVSEEILVKLIKQCRIADVFHVYKLIEENVSKETKLAVFEMLCFYNSEVNEVSVEFPELTQFQTISDSFKNTWKTSSDIEKLFEELKEDSTTMEGAYNALISGMAKYFNVDQAWQLYNECLDKNIPLALTSFNSILSISSLLKDNDEERKVLIIKLLTTMASKEIVPNITTLNAALKSASKILNQRLAKDFVLSLITEFKSIGIKPCLTSYCYLLNIFYQDNDSSSNILIDILNELEKEKEITIQDPMDILFFSQAMNIATNHMHNVSVADKIHKLLLSNNNYKFIGRDNHVSEYYRSYLQIILRSETIDQFMTVYDTVIPHLYVPETMLLKEVLEILKLNDPEVSIQFMPKILSQLISFGMLDKHAVMSTVFQLMIDHCIPQPKSDLHTQYADVAWSLWTHIEVLKAKNLRRAQWSGKIFGDMAVLLIRGEQFEKMLTVIEFLSHSQDSVIGCMHPKRLQQIFDACLVRGHAVGAMITVEYAFEYGFVNAEIMAKTIISNIPLTSLQEKKLYDLFGNNILQSTTITKT